MENVDPSTSAEQRYNAVQRTTKSDSGHFKKMLAQQLKELEYHDIVHREVYAQIPPKVEYSITEYGQRMKPLLQAMSDWGIGHVEHMRELNDKDNEVTEGSFGLRNGL